MLKFLYLAHKLFWFRWVVCEFKKFPGYVDAMKRTEET